MSQTEDSKSIMKLSYAWIIIMFTLNSFYAFYVVTDQSFADGDTLYNLFMAPGGTMSKSINTVETDIGKYQNKSITGIGGDDDKTLLDYLDGMLDFAGWIGFVGVMMTLGGVYTSFHVYSMVENDFLRLIIQFFLIIGNVIWGIQVIRWMTNRRGE